MNFIIILVGIIVVLFAASYFTKRRYGVLGLALGAGSILSGFWASDVTAFIQGAGVELVTPPLSSIVAAVLIVLPAVVLFFSGPTYNKRWQRLVGSLMFALLSVTFMLVPFADVLTLDTVGSKIFTELSSNSSLIITAGLLYALYDVLIVRTPKNKDKEK